MFLHVFHYGSPHPFLPRSVALPSFSSEGLGTALAMVWFPELSSVTLAGP